MPSIPTHPHPPRRRRRTLAGVVVAGTLGLGTLGLGASPAAAAPESYFSAVDGNIAVKGSPSEFNGVNIEGTFDADTGELTALATFPQTTQVREDNPLPGLDAEVVLQVSQPEPAVGTITEGEVVLDAEFQIVVDSLTLIDQASGDRTELPLGPEPDSCKFAPIDVELRGTAAPSSPDGPLTVSVADPEFVIPEPADPANDCGPLGGALIPNIAGPNEGEDPNSVELAFTLNSSQAVVQSLYQTVLGRAAEPEGLEYWSGRLEAGVSPTRIAISIARSREGWRSAVIDSYRIALDRDPEPAGLLYWTEAMVKSQDQVYLVSYLFASAEADGLAREAFPEATGTEAYVQYLYGTLLDRTPSEGDLAFWTQRINNAANQNVSRKAAAEFFFKSPEIIHVLVRDASLLVCDAPPSGAQEEILRDALVSSKFQTRVLLAVATVTPCPAVPS